MAKNLAYIYKNSVVISNNEEEARKILKCPKNEKLLVEPAKAYHTTNLLATTSKEVRTNKKVNMEYWHYIESIIRSHLTACIEELKDWSVTDVKFGDSKEEEKEILDEITDNLEKSIEYKIIADLQHWGGADFPYVDEDY